MLVFVLVKIKVWIMKTRQKDRRSLLPTANDLFYQDNMN